MPLKIRLARGGAKKRPYYRIVVADARAPRDGRYIDRVGTFNPLLPKDSAERVTLNEDKIKDWMAKGAKPTDRVLRFFDAAGLATRPARNNPKKALPGKKAQERLDARREAEEEAAEAAKAAAAEAEAAPAEEAAAEEAVAEEAPAEEAPAEEAPTEEASAEEGAAEEAAAEDAGEDAAAEKA